MAKGRDLLIKIMANADQLLREMGKADAATDTFGGKAQAAFGKLATGVAVGAAALGTATVVAKGFADAAGDLGEAQNAAASIFGDSAGDIEAFGAAAAKAYGLSNREATEAANSFGAMLKTTGLGSDAIADMSTSLVGLSADVGSLRNMSAEEIFDKFGSALAGEAEGVRRLGIDISAAAVQAKAAELGFGSLTGELTEAEKVQARYALILAGSTDAIDDFGDTSGSLANSQKVLSAEWENMQAVLGEKLSPAFASVFSFIAEKMPEVIEWLGPKLQGAIDSMAAAWEEHGPGIVATIESLWGAIQTVWTITQPIFEQLVTAFGNLFTVFTETVAFFDAVIHGEWSEAWEALGNIFGAIWDNIVGAFEALWQTFKNLGVELLQGFWDGLKEKWGEVWGWVTGKVDEVKGALGLGSFSSSDAFREAEAYAASQDALLLSSVVDGGGPTTLRRPMTINNNINTPDPATVGILNVELIRSQSPSALVSDGVP